MFDDPKRTLAYMQSQLLESEDPEEALEDVKNILRKDEWEGTHRRPLSQEYITDVLEPEEEQEEPRQSSAPAVRNSNFPLLLLFVILAVLGGWILWK